MTVRMRPTRRGRCEPKGVRRSLGGKVVRVRGNEDKRAVRRPSWTSGVTAQQSNAEPALGGKPEHEEVERPGSLLTASCGSPPSHTTSTARSVATSASVPSTAATGRALRRRIRRSRRRSSLLVRFDLCSCLGHASVRARCARTIQRCLSRVPASARGDPPTRDRTPTCGRSDAACAWPRRRVSRRSRLGRRGFAQRARRQGDPSRSSRRRSRPDRRGDAPSATARSATWSAKARHDATSSSRNRWTDRNWRPCTFRCACLPLRARSTRSTSMR